MILATSSPGPSPRSAILKIVEEKALGTRLVILGADQKERGLWEREWSTGMCLLVPRGRAPFGQHQESRPLANTGSPRFTDFPSLCACSESSLTNLIGSGLNLLCLQSHSKTECRWTRPEVPQRSNECACLSRARARGNGLHHFHRNKQRQNGGRFKFRSMCFISRG